MENPFAPLDLSLSDSERSKSRPPIFCVVGKLYVTDGRILIWMAHKITCGRVGFSAVPVVFLVAAYNNVNT